MFLMLLVDGNELYCLYFKDHQAVVHVACPPPVSESLLADPERFAYISPHMWLIISSQTISA